MVWNLQLVETGRSKTQVWLSKNLCWARAGPVLKHQKQPAVMLSQGRASSETPEAASSDVLKHQKQPAVMLSQGRASSETPEAASSDVLKHQKQPQPASGLWIPPKAIRCFARGGMRNRTYYKGPGRGGVVLGGGAFDQQRVLCNRVLKFQEPRGVDGVIVFLFFLLLLLLLNRPNYWKFFREPLDANICLVFWWFFVLSWNDYVLSIRRCINISWLENTSTHATNSINKFGAQGWFQILGTLGFHFLFLFESVFFKQFNPLTLWKHSKPLRYRWIFCRGSCGWSSVGNFRFPIPNQQRAMIHWLFPHQLVEALEQKENCVNFLVQNWMGPPTSRFLHTIAFTKKINQFVCIIDGVCQVCGSFWNRWLVFWAIKSVHITPHLFSVDSAVCGGNPHAFWRIQVYLNGIYPDVVQTEATKYFPLRRTVQETYPILHVQNYSQICSFLALCCHGRSNGFAPARWHCFSQYKGFFHPQFRGTNLLWPAWLPRFT